MLLFVYLWYDLYNRYTYVLSVVLRCLLCVVYCSCFKTGHHQHHHHHHHHLSLHRPYSIRWHGYRRTNSSSANQSNGQLHVVKSCRCRNFQLSRDVAQRSFQAWIRFTNRHVTTCAHAIVTTFCPYNFTSRTDISSKFHRSLYKTVDFVARTVKNS